MEDMELDDDYCPECGGPRDDYPWYTCTECQYRMAEEQESEDE